jgi:Na+-transporting methylmalonyl-CoA/oxaloacetate decarboxylase gamma subunit
VKKIISNLFLLAMLVTFQAQASVTVEEARQNAKDAKEQRKNEKEQKREAIIERAAKEEKRKREALIQEQKLLLLTRRIFQDVDKLGCVCPEAFP